MHTEEIRINMDTFHLGRQALEFKQIEQIVNDNLLIDLDASAWENIDRCRRFLDQKIEEPGAVYYGINTGFGALCNVQISKQDIGKLQQNLVLSHACGMGEEVPERIIRLMLLLKIQNFSYGHSGVSRQLVERLLNYFNHQVYPVVYTQGSLGASGDLAPLAHLSLPLLDEGEVWYEGSKQSARSVNARFAWDALSLQSKEGLALLNGTQFMSAYAVDSLLEIRHWLPWSDAIAALSFDAFDCTLQPFDPDIQQVRAHRGQMETARNMRAWLEGSEISQQTKSQVQDPYSFRCIPQVHGATRDVVYQTERVVHCEINSVTDNPLIFPDQDKIVSGGNFHGQPLALHLDYLAMAVAELGSISERRIYLLISGQRGLPPFLVQGAGLDSGFMIAQYTAASIVSQSKQLCTPASVDSIVSSNGQEDHVSMGANAATKLAQVVQNTARILAIEWLCACQALAWRDKAKTSPQLAALRDRFREMVPHLENDRFLHADMQASLQFLQSNQAVMTHS